MEQTVKLDELEFVPVIMNDALDFYTTFIV